MNLEETLIIIFSTIGIIFLLNLLIWILVWRKKEYSLNYDNISKFKLSFNDRKKFYGDYTISDSYYEIEFTESLDRRVSDSISDNYSFRFFPFNLSKSNSSKYYEKIKAVNFNKMEDAWLLVESKKIIIISNSYNKKILFADIFEIGRMDEDNILAFYIISSKGKTNFANMNIFVKTKNHETYNKLFNEINQANKDRKEILSNNSEEIIA